MNVFPRRSDFLLASLNYLMKLFPRRSDFLLALLNYLMNLFPRRSYVLLAPLNYKFWNFVVSGMTRVAMGLYFGKTKLRALERFLNISWVLARTLRGCCACCAGRCACCADVARTLRGTLRRTLRGRCATLRARCACCAGRF